MFGITILGSTGSIGLSTLDVIARHPERYRVIALAAGRNTEVLLQQCMAYNPLYAVLYDTKSAEQLSVQLKAVGSKTTVLSGNSGLETIASLPEADYVMAAIVGATGLLPTLAAVKAGKKVLLANKEALVMTGELFMQEVKRHHATLLPVDSEHNAIFQCMPLDFIPGQPPAGVRRILLTASGGAFRNQTLAELKNVTPEQACQHPNWDMGPKVTVDSATMVNKALEIIEAHWLFAVQPEQIQTLLHPQSIVHSLVEYTDGSVLAQLGNPDMRTPIAQALAWPERIESGVSSLDLLIQNRLDFAPMDFNRFPCVDLAYQTLKTGGTAPTVLNAANEIAVQAFLQHELAFLDIYTIIAEVLDKLPSKKADNLETILEENIRARECAKRIISSMARKAVGV